MRVSLLYNAEAGNSVPLDRIREAISQHGHDLVGLIEQNADLEQVLQDCPDIVVAAGGDGTVGTAVQMLAPRGIPLAILPLGTANNIAKSLGIRGSVDDVIGSWKTARHVPFDRGVVAGAWGRRFFVESVGGGLIPTAIAVMDARSDGDQLQASAKVAGAVQTFGDVLSRLQPVEWTIVADGARITGKFILVEVLNIRSIGPNLVFSPDANPADGLFRVVLAGEQHRDTIARYLRDRLERGCHPLSLPSQCARTVTLQGVTDIHVDDKVLSNSPSQNVSIEIEAGVVEILCPAHQATQACP